MKLLPKFSLKVEEEIFLRLIDEKEVDILFQLVDFNRAGFSSFSSFKSFDLILSSLLKANVPITNLSRKVEAFV